MYRTLLGILAVFAVALLLVALSFSAAAETPADLRFNNGTEPKTLDPALMTGQPEGRIADAIFEGLTFREAKTLEPQPGMAERWDVSDDERTYTFHMREGAVWSDGTPVTAHDFAYSWKRLQDPALGAEYAYILHMVKWAEVYNTYSGQVDMLIDTEDADGRRKAGIVSDVLALADGHATGVGGAKWQEFLDAKHAAEALKNVEDPLLQEALSQRDGVVSRERLVVIADAMMREAERRLSLHAEAVKHFGVDEGVWAVDDRTLKVELNAPTPYFLELTAFYPSFPVPRWVVETPGNELDWFIPEKIVTNGPFSLESWRPNDKMRLVKSPTYWGRDEVRLNVVDAYPLSNATTALNLYLQGDLDWTTTYPDDLVRVLKKREDFRTNTGFIVYYYRFNCTRPHLSDPRVRRALCMAIDRESIIEHILKLGQEPAYLLVPPMSGYEPPESGIRFDPEAARALLKEAGVDPGALGGSDGLGILFNEHPVHTKIAENVAEQLYRNLGIPARDRVTAYNQEWQAYQANTRKLNYDIARAGWIGDYLDPNTFLDLWVTNGGNNQTGWGDPRFDRLIQLAQNVTPLIEAPDEILASLREPDRARELLTAARDAPAGAARIAARQRLRMHVLREAEAVLVQEAFPIMPVYFYVVSALVRPYVKGYYTELEFEDGSTKPNLQDLHPLRDLWIEHGPSDRGR